jgi:DNA polymerase-4
VRIRNDIVSSLGIEPAAAVGRNKLVAKVAARSIRPAGIACIRAGDEAGYLATQDAFLLPGVGPAISRVLSVAGIREIGQLASLTDAEALSLFGRRALALRNAALGLDGSAVASGDLDQRAILRSVEFEADALESGSIRAALVTAIEDAGLELRGALLAARRLRLVVRYADGCAAEAEERSRAALFLDSDLIAAADEAYAEAAVRRVRLRGFAIALSDLAPARREPDLFVPDGPTRLERLQAAVDGSRLRYGASAVTRACALLGRGDAR